MQSGGICGKFYLGNGKSIRNSYNKAKVESSSKDVINSGGITGELGNSGQNFSIVNCYNLGEVVVNTPEGRVSGILGFMASENSNVSNVFNVGKIILEDGKYAGGYYGAGGILGAILLNANNTSMNNAYNIGIIELNNTINQNIGSIIGNVGEDIILSNCYFLTGTYGVGVGYGNSAGVTEKNDISDFPSVLEVVNGEGAFKEDVNNINGGYPILEWQ